MADPSPKAKKKWHPWPVGIVSYYLFFVFLCVVFAIKARGVRFDLVAGDYYEQGVRHDARMAAITRMRSLSVQHYLEVDESQHRLIVRMPPEARGALLTLYRAADAREDRKYALQDIVPSVIDYGTLPHGRWQVQIAWELDGNPYYFQEDVFLP